MPRPLDIEIGMHYCVSGGRFARAGAPEAQRTEACMADAGLLRWNDKQQCFEATDGLHMWLQALCHVPFPEQRWVMPEVDNFVPQDDGPIEEGGGQVNGYS